MKWDGTSWQEVPYSLQHIPTALWSQSRDDIWMVSSLVGTGHFTDRIQHWDGQKWQGAPLNPFWLCGVWSGGPRDVWAIGMQGEAWHWDGSTWSRGGPTLVGEKKSACAIWGSGPDDIWAAGGSTVTHWNGGSWTTVDLPAQDTTAI